MMRNFVARQFPSYCAHDDMAGGPSVSGHSRFRRTKHSSSPLLRMFYRWGENISTTAGVSLASSPTYLNRSGSDWPCHPRECCARQPRGFGVLSQRFPSLLRNEASPLL